MFLLPLQYKMLFWWLSNHAGSYDYQVLHKLVKVMNLESSCHRSKRETNQILSHFDIHINFISNCYADNINVLKWIEAINLRLYIHSSAHIHCILSLNALLMAYSEGYHSGWHLHVSQSPRRPLRGASSTHKHKQTAQAHNKKQHLKVQDISWQRDDSLAVCNVDVVCFSLINTLMLLPWLTSKQCRCFKRVSSGLTSYITAP